jgi:hypothetical protein
MPVKSLSRSRQRGIALWSPKLYFSEMGRTFQFECPQCQYQARVGGGADAGINCSVQTIVCLDCRRLFDVFTRFRLREGEEEPAPADVKTRSSRIRLPDEVNIPPFWLVKDPWNVFAPGRRSSGPPRQQHWAAVKPVCPVAASHRIKIWNAPGRCPRCGNYLEKNGLPYRLWE